MNNNIMTWQRFLTILIFIIPYLGNAQGNDIKLAVNYHPDSKYVAPADSISRDGSSSQLEISINSHINLYTKIDTLTGKVRLLNAAVFTKKTSFSNTGFNREILPNDLYSLSAGLSYYSTMNQKWAYTLFLNSALNSDFSAVDYNDIFLTGGVIFIRQFSPNLRLGFGAIVHNNLGTPMFWPALSVYWHFGERFNIDIRVPDEGQGLAYTIGVGYELKKNLKLGFAFKPQMTSYDVEIRKNIDNRLMNYWQLPFELSGIYTQGNFEYTATVGFTALRSFAYAEKKLENMFTEYPYYGLNTNLLFSTGVKYRF